MENINFENIEMTIYVIKNIFAIICSYFIFFKVIGRKNEKNILLVIVSSIAIAILVAYVKYNIGTFIGMVVMIILFSILCSISSKCGMGYTIVIAIISLSINYVIFVVAITIVFLINVKSSIHNDFINLSFMMLIDLILLKGLFSIKRFKYGITFLNKNNQYIDLILLNICVSILFSSIIFSNMNIEISKELFVEFIISIIVMCITIQKSLQLYYKQKMLIKELDETKEDLARAENKIKILEKENIEESKKRHTVIHKQKSLEYKIEEMLTKTEMSTEEAAEVKERLEKLNKEIYTEKEVMELDKTGINSIDDMLKYMQSECVKNKIDFTLQIKGNIHYMVHNLVKEEELETLLADHIKDAIIAINHTDNANRSILVRLGNIDDIYSLYIYDSGVEFKPEVLENLGKKPCTTYANEGGTGMGFMNTFDTVRKHKASLIIEEIGKPVKDNYTKVIIIKFDKKNEFKVKSYHEIEKV